MKARSTVGFTLLLWPVLLGTGLFLSGPLALAADPPRPNILFIYADDQSYKTLSCYQQSPSWVKTPHIDRLAQHGHRFLGLVRTVRGGHPGAWPARGVKVSECDEMISEGSALVASPGGEHRDQRPLVDQAVLEGQQAE